MKKNEGLQKTSEPRVPPATDSQRRAMEAFLVHFDHRISASLDSYRQLSLTDSSDELRGQITYHKHQLATIRWLRSLNVTRRRNGKAPATR
jgi:hypothetical protein